MSGRDFLFPSYRQSTGIRIIADDESDPRMRNFSGMNSIHYRFKIGTFP